ncbi:MAG: UDP-glucose 6-dehydrogenase, partial [Gemmatimonadetes bacterium]|nr:UDP-glucose 6-dehydrogenase [Gemmatimonadota bacterium]
RAVLPEADYESDPYEAVRDASVLMILTEWPEYRGLDYSRIASGMRERNLVDGRNLLDPVLMRRLGFNYEGVGR